MKARVANESLADLLDRHTTQAAAELCREEQGRLRCLACGHRCLIGPGLRGICKVRFNHAGTLQVPFGYVAGLQCDPVEKKPFFHVLPGSDALTFGMMGCDLHCSYCQNWVTSQALRDSSAMAPVRPITAEQLVETARREGARLVVSSYNEPLITAEWAVHVFQKARAAGLACAFVSNGNATPEVLDFFRPWVIAYKVDLKSFRDANYRSLGGKLDNITDTIRRIHERGIWLEIVTLVIPGFNDSEAELRDLARFLVSVSPDIPWHVTAFHPDYRMTDPAATPARTLMRAAELGAAAGLRYIYAGNLPGQVGEWEDTRCPGCRRTLIQRFGYLIRSYQVTADGLCPHCRTRIPGVWPQAPEEVRTGNDESAYRDRLPRPVAPAGQPAPRNRELPVLAPGRHSPIGGAPALSATRTQPSAARLELTGEQKERLKEAASAMLRYSVASQQQPTFPPELADLRDVPVAGAFVSLKRGRHLRSCCGTIGRPTSLAQALEQAVARAAWDDARFPPISPSELDYLDLEVWLLHQLERITARGDERLQAVTIGKHGVQVVRGDGHGLFLPSVPIDQQWDVRRYLDQVCLKAGLFPTAWRDDSTALFTFEGEAVRGKLGGTPGPRPNRTRLFFEPDQLSSYTDFCRRNLHALLTGATPSYYLWGAPDGMVHGAVVLLHRPGSEPVTVAFHKVSLRPALPLQATLFQLVQTAVQQLGRMGWPLELTGDCSIGLAVLHDPVLHGTVAEPHLDDFDPQRRALLVQERNKAALLYDPDRPADQVLAEAAAQAKVSQPAHAPVFSLETVTNTRPVSVSTVPTPVRGPAVRPAAVAGTFYDADPTALARTVDELLEGERTGEPWPAAMVPHAGLRFSGRVAAAVLRRLHIPRSVIIIGPKHTPLGMDWAVAPQQTWAIPGGGVESDFVLARQLCQTIPGLEMDAAAHQREHAIEVELPLLARLAPQARVVGIVIGHGDWESCRHFAAGLARLVKERDQIPLLLISSDMNHFAPDAENRRLDALALEAMQSGDPARLYHTVRENHISMCGLLPAVIVMQTLRLLGRLQRVERVAYATSADTTGDPSRVVGYAGVLLG
jgi:AmmeMemoRadiSam system radical SAM enzyme/AmmeMemoRadiSam system protein B/AmmeMemoRadiSam system protein A